MAAQDPSKTTATDICTEALRDAGVIGIGQPAYGDQIAVAQTRLTWMLNEWARKRWFVFYLQTLSIVATGAQSYTIGPGGDLDTGVDSVRPAKIASAFLRQIQTTQPNQVDYPLEILQSKEDYNRIALKQLNSFPGAIFLDPQWPLGLLYPWPVPQASIYAVHVTVMCQLPQTFASATSRMNTVFNLPYEYYSAMELNLALRLRSAFQIGSYPGDQLERLAKVALKTLVGANTAIARLQVPDMNRSFQYNIFSDRYY